MTLANSKGEGLLIDPNVLKREQGLLRIKFPYVLILQVGDVGGDRHGIYETHVFRCNASIGDVSGSHEAGSKVLGYKLEDQCRHYGETRLALAFVEALREHGIEPELEALYPINDGSFTGTVHHKEWCRIYLEIAKLHRTDLDWELVEHSEKHIGGYGLFE